MVVSALQLVSLSTDGPAGGGCGRGGLRQGRGGGSSWEEDATPASALFIFLVNNRVGQSFEDAQAHLLGCQLHVPGHHQSQHSLWRQSCCPGRGFRADTAGRPPHPSMRSPRRQTEQSQLLGAGLGLPAEDQRAVSAA